MTTALPRRHALPLLTGCALAIAAAGCSTAPLLQKQSFDFKSTALFQNPCPVPPAPREPEPPPQANEERVVALQGPGGPSLETKENRCNTTYLEKMVENFLSIQEADDRRGIDGDSIEDVRRKGFSIFIGGDPRIRRPNTRALHGADALAAIGMGVSPPPLQKVEDISAYTEFMGQHYGEEYAEKDMKQVVDRFCLNRRESLDIGDDRVFTIVWRRGRVIKRVIKGGPIENPRQERGFLLCPGEFIVDTLTGTVRGALKMVAPTP